MIKFHDFAPVLLESGFLSGNKYETLREALDKANQWIASKGVDVINVETVVLPNLNSGGLGTSEVELTASGKFQSTWHQFIRVWYRAN